MTVKTRIDLPPDTYRFRGPGGHMVYINAFEVWLRGVEDRDMLRQDPTVMLVPIGREDKVYSDFSFDVPLEYLDQVIDALREKRIEAEKCEGGVRYELERRGLKYEPCGLNADWSTSAWHLSPGGANMTSGSYYLLDEEDTDLDDREVFSIVRRTWEGDDGPASWIGPLKQGKLPEVLDWFKALSGESISCDACGKAVPALEIWTTKNESTVCKGCYKTEGTN